MPVENEYRLAARIMSLGFESQGMDPDAIAKMLLAYRAEVSASVLEELVLTASNVTVASTASPTSLSIALAELQARYGVK